MQPSICPLCKKEFKASPARFRRGHKVYCSKECSYLGRHKQEELICLTCKKNFISHECRKAQFCSQECFKIHNSGSNHYLWKGRKTTYSAQHHWIRRMKGKASSCERCGLKEIPKGMKRYFQWANISKKYLRDVNDYVSLCILCHKKFDSQ